MHKRICDLTVADSDASDSPPRLLFRGSVHPQKTTAVLLSCHLRAQRVLDSKEQHLEGCLRHEVHHLEAHSQAVPLHSCHVAAY